MQTPLINFKTFQLSGQSARPSASVPAPAPAPAPGLVPKPFKGKSVAFISMNGEGQPLVETNGVQFQLGPEIPKQQTEQTSLPQQQFFPSIFQQFQRRPQEMQSTFQQPHQPYQHFQTQHVRNMQPIEQHLQQKQPEFHNMHQPSQRSLKQPEISYQQSLFKQPVQNVQQQWQPVGKHCQTYFELVNQQRMQPTQQVLQQSQLLPQHQEPAYSLVNNAQPEPLPFRSSNPFNSQAVVGAQQFISSRQLPERVSLPHVQQPLDQLKSRINALNRQKKQIAHKNNAATHNQLTVNQQQGLTSGLSQSPVAQQKLTCSSDLATQPTTSSIFQLNCPIIPENSIVSENVSNDPETTSKPTTEIKDQMTQMKDNDTEVFQNVVDVEQEARDRERIINVQNISNMLKCKAFAAGLTSVEATAAELVAMAVEEKLKSLITSVSSEATLRLQQDIRKTFTGERKKHRELERKLEETKVKRPRDNLDIVLTLAAKRQKRVDEERHSEMSETLLKALGKPTKSILASPNQENVASKKESENQKSSKTVVTANIKDLLVAMKKDRHFKYSHLTQQYHWKYNIE